VIEYQNLFTRVQVRSSAPEMGVALRGGSWVRQVQPFHIRWLGWIGDAQIGPIYLGWLGVASLICGLISFEIIGLNMWASVNWDPMQFVRQLPWLALEPPPPAYGLHLPPLAQKAAGGSWPGSS
jgi:photosynthetic reaction center M subunit